MKKEMSSPSSAAGSLLIPRRQFLVLGSAAVAAVAATSLSADIVRRIAVTEEVQRLSVGFIDAAIHDFADASIVRALTPAARLSAEAALPETLRVKIHGVVRPEAVKDSPVSMAVDAMYRVDGVQNEVPFLAWSYTRRPHSVSLSGNDSFLMPMRESQSLKLALSTSAVASQTENATLRGTLSLGTSRRGANKLRMGVYFATICPNGSAEPNWDSIRAVAPEDGAQFPVLKTAGLTGLEAVPFEYIVFSTEPA